MTNISRRVAILGGARIPFARANTAYNELGNQDMLTAAFRFLVEKYSLKNERVGEVAAGAVIKHSRARFQSREHARRRAASRDAGLRPAARLRHQPFRHRAA